MLLGVRFMLPPLLPQPPLLLPQSLLLVLPAQAAQGSGLPKQGHCQWGLLYPLLAMLPLGLSCCC
jgi:hypothetical protein